MLLVAEMGLFVLLIVPLPFNWRLKVRYLCNNFNTFGC